MFLAAFVLVPFAYFFYEEWDDETTFSERVFGALKYTCGLFVALAVVCAGGFLVFSGARPARDYDWVARLIDPARNLAAANSQWHRALAGSSRQSS